MLCNFSYTDKNVTPAVRRTIIVNTDLTWKVIIGHKNVNGEMQIPKVLKHAGDFVYLFNLVDASVLCTGICDYDLVTLALSGHRCDTFKDRHGNFKAHGMVSCTWYLCYCTWYLWCVYARHVSLTAIHYLPYCEKNDVCQL